VLDVERGQHDDPRRHQLLDVLPSLLVPASGDVGVGQLIDHHYLRVPGQDCVEVHLLEQRVPMENRPSGHHLQALQQGGNRGATVGLHEAHHHVLAPLLEPVSHPEGRVGLADPGGIGQPHVQSAASRPVGHVAPSMRQIGHA